MDVFLKQLDEALKFMLNVYQILVFLSGNI